MLFITHDSQVFRPVVEFVTVDMVNVLGRIEWPAQNPLHHKAMLRNSSAIDPNATVAALVDASVSLRGTPTRSAPGHIRPGYRRTAVDAQLPLRLLSGLMTSGASGAAGANRHSAIPAQLGRLWVRHFLTSYTGLRVRRARSVAALPGFSLPKLYQNPS